MAKPRLSLDADASSRTLQRDLQERGHDVTRTPTEWMPPDASDEMQLLDTTAHGRSIFTFNIVDFLRLAQRFPEHQGIIVANQWDWTLSTLIGSLDRLLTETLAAGMRSQVRWLNEWRS